VQVLYGGAITAVAAAITIAGGIFTGLGVQRSPEDDNRCLRTVGLGVLLTGFLLSALGVPLMVYGSMPPEPQATWATRAIPRVVPEPGAVTLRWTF
jgi:hypothetical protein